MRSRAHIEMTSSSDERLRELERRWRLTGASVDEAALLQERLRVGDLAFDRLELAAGLGHEAARQVVTSHPVRDLPGDLLRWGKPALVCAAVAAARILCDLWTKERPADRRPFDTLDVVAAWLACPCIAHLRAVRDLAHASSIPADWARGDHPMQFHAAGWVPNVLWVALAPSARSVPRPLEELIDIAGREVTAEQVRASITAALCEWALGPATRTSGPSAQRSSDPGR